MRIKKYTICWYMHVILCWQYLKTSCLHSYLFNKVCVNKSIHIYRGVHIYSIRNACINVCNVFIHACHTLLTTPQHTLFVFNKTCVYISMRCNHICVSYFVDNTSTLHVYIQIYIQIYIHVYILVYPLRYAYTKVIISTKVCIFIQYCMRIQKCVMYSYMCVIFCWQYLNNPYVCPTRNVYQ